MMPFESKQPSFQRLCVHYAERRRPIVFWVGSGLSVNAGLPTWPQLKSALVQAALDGATTLGAEDGKIAEARIEGARAEPNPWEAFRSLKNVMGDAEYYASIRSIFDKSAIVVPPDMYTIIWSLKTTGIISLNIDGFANRSFPHHRTEELQIFHGKEAKNYVQAISQGRRFVANLHGNKEDVSTWVFTKDELNSLIGDQAYVTFINFIFSSMTVVFVGISAEDTAVGGFLEKLSRLGVDVGPHFWITDRIDTQSQQWSANNGVQIVRYVAERDRFNKLNHDIPLGEIFESLRHYVSFEKTPAAVVPSVLGSSARISTKELRHKSEDEARLILASYARDILDRNNNDTSSDDYRDFLKLYHSNIHQAWHITNYEGENEFFGYTVVEKISASTFSNVWRLMDDNGNNFALKVIQIDNLRSGPQLESFRRGVQSMNYLTKADVPGTPRLIEAHEIPPCVIMTYVEGHDFQGLVKRSGFNFWSEGTRILINACKSIEYGHNLPQGVLHRDVRPSNIMVPDYYLSDQQAIDTNVDKYTAVLLNYDMSWHSSAKGSTIAGNIEESGFYPPEMINGIQDNMARSTAVDSYGLGMTIYFSFTKCLPPSGGSKSTDWANLLNTAFRPNKNLTWHSAPVRLKRLIQAATLPNEDARISVSIIGRRLEMLLRSVQGRFADISTDFWAEELLCRAFSYRDYRTNQDESEFSHEPIPGRVISIRANFNINSLEMRFENISTGAADRNAGKNWGERLNSAREILQSSGWKVSSETNYRALNLVLSATIAVEDVRVDIARAAKNLDHAINQVRID